MSAREAFVAEWDVLRAWIAGLDDDQLGRASVLDGWTVRDLVAHVAQATDVLRHFEPVRGQTPASLATYVGTYPGRAEAIAKGTRMRAREWDGRLDVLLDDTWEQATAALEELGPDERAVVANPRRGAIRLGDLIRTRLLELVVHGDDLARSLPDVAPPAHPSAALREVVKALLGVLAERVPGRSVEVRVPPYAAVQCIGGTTHSRGTPPNVVETDPLTWVRLACGRVPWVEAVASGAVSASGSRADLRAELPLL